MNARSSIGSNRIGRRALTGLPLCLLAALLSGGLHAEPASFCEYGKTQLVFPDDPFEHRQFTGATNLGWVKFTLLKPPYDPNIVYFQDSGHFPLHYDFVSSCLGPYVEIDPQEFDRVTLYEEDQQMVLGAVITPPIGFGVVAPIQEYGIQFVRYDPYSRQELAALFQTVTAAISSDPNVQPYYFPTYEQSESARQNAAWFAQQGILISSADRWTRGNAIYSEGWALGRLRYVAPDEIDAAYSRNDLRPGDILLTDAVPAEIPVVAGVVSLTAATPNSHVAILANTYAIPFVHLAEQTDQQRALELDGRRVALRAYARYGRIDVQLRDAGNSVTDDQAAEFLTLKQPPALNIQAVEPLGRYSASVDSLEPNDIRHFGGKAANYATLRRAIPKNSRPAIAFSFDLWNEFLDQALTNGKTLRQEVTHRLSGYVFPPISAAALEYELEQIRELFKDDRATHFSPVLKDAVIAALTDPEHEFDPNRKIRFRSSTNVEDSEHFSGAGLYDSYSGCLADDLDDDDSGPSHCDSDRRKERGVFRAIRRVFASFYNDNAYLERLRHGIAEDEVGMAILVHHSFPDDIELANGVAVMQIEAYGTTISLATQDGAVSVANPQPGLIPEEVTASTSNGGEQVYVRVSRHSNLVPLGQTVMAWPDDYQELARLLVQAATQYERDTRRTPHLLDFEYKKIAPHGHLVVKQIRPIPSPSDDVADRRFLLGGPIDLSVLQGEFGEPLALHRLKSHWQLEAGSRWIAPEMLAESLFQDAHLEYHDEGRIWTQSGSLASWPEAQHDLVKAKLEQGFEVTDGWQFDHLPNPRRYTLTTIFNANGLLPPRCAVLFLSDFRYELDVEYAEPVLAWDWSQGGAVTGTTSDWAPLAVSLQPDRGDSLQTRRIKHGGVTVEISFYWPPPPTGPTAGYTAPLARWVQATVTGLTREPFTLTDPYALTYGAGHHNFFERFLIEPRLEPGLSQDLLNELRAKGIDLISAATGFGQSTIETYDLVDTSFPPADAENQ